MKKYFLLIVLTLTFSSCQQGINTVAENIIQDEEIEKKIEASEEPITEEIGHQKDDVSKFIPQGYEILDTISGDLNLDGKIDLLLVLKKSIENAIDYDDPNFPSLERPFLILLRNNANKLELACKSENIVYCIDCAGAMGDPYLKTVIKEGYFSLEFHGGGNVWRWDRIITFKYSKQENDWLLHKDSFESYNLMEYDNANVKIQTTKDFGRVKFDDFKVSEYEVN